MPSSGSSSTVDSTTSSTSASRASASSSTATTSGSGSSLSYYSSSSQYPEYENKKRKPLFHPESFDPERGTKYCGNVRWNKPASWITIPRAFHVIFIPLLLCLFSLAVIHFLRYGKNKPSYLIPNGPCYASLMSQLNASLGTSAGFAPQSQASSRAPALVEDYVMSGGFNADYEYVWRVAVDPVLVGVPNEVIGVLSGGTARAKSREFNLPFSHIPQTCTGLSTDQVRNTAAAVALTASATLARIIGHLGAPSIVPVIACCKLNDSDWSGSSLFCVDNEFRRLECGLPMRRFWWIIVFTVIIFASLLFFVKTFLVEINVSFVNGIIRILNPDALYQQDRWFAFYPAYSSIEIRALHAFFMGFSAVLIVQTSQLFAAFGNDDIGVWAGAVLCIVTSVFLILYTILSRGLHSAIKPKRHKMGTVYRLLCVILLGLTGIIFSIQLPFFLMSISWDVRYAYGRIAFQIFVFAYVARLFRDIVWMATHRVTNRTEYPHQVFMLDYGNGVMSAETRRIMWEFYFSLILVSVVSEPVIEGTMILTVVFSVLLGTRLYCLSPLGLLSPSDEALAFEYERRAISASGIDKKAKDGERPKERNTTPLLIASQVGEVTLGARTFRFPRAVMSRFVQNYPGLVNAANHERRTALHFSVAAGDIDMIQFLMENGANFTMKGYDPISKTKSKTVNINFDPKDVDAPKSLKRKTKVTLFSQYRRRTPLGELVVRAIDDAAFSLQYEDEDDSEKVHFVRTRPTVQSLTKAMTVFIGLMKARSEDQANMVIDTVLSEVVAAVQGDEDTRKEARKLASSLYRENRDYENDALTDDGREYYCFRYSKALFMQSRGAVAFHYIMLLASYLPIDLLCSKKYADVDVDDDDDVEGIVLAWLRKELK